MRVLPILEKKVVPHNLREIAMEENMITGFSLPLAQDTLATLAGRKSHKGSSSLKNIHSVDMVEHDSPNKSLNSGGEPKGSRFFYRGNND